MPFLSVLARLYAPALDPVFKKDLEGLSRRWGIYVARMVYVALIGLLLYVFMDAFGLPDSTSRYANVGRVLFSALITLQMFYVTFATAHLAADLLLREARSGTLLLLLLTPLSGWRIALGKWKAVMAHASMVILTGMPPLAIAAYLGGIGPWDLLWSASVSLGLAALSSSMGFYGAIRSRTPTRAAFAAVVMIGLPAGVLLLVAGVLFSFTHSDAVWFVAGLLHPGVAAIGASNGAWFGEPATYAWIGSSLGWLLLAQIFLMSAAGHLSTSAALDELLAPRGLAPSEQAPGIPSLEHRTVWDAHPLLWKEIFCTTFSRLGWTRRTTVAAFLPIPLLVLAGFNYSAPGPVLKNWLLVLTGLAMASGAELFVKDKEGRHLEVLFTLPVSSAQWVWAKLLSRVVTVEGIAFLAWTVLMVECLIGRPTALFVLTSPVLLFVLFAYVLSAVASLYLRTQRGAFLLAASLVWSLLLAAPVLEQSLPGRMLASLHPMFLGRTILETGPAGCPELVCFTLVYGCALALMIALMIRGFRRQAV